MNVPRFWHAANASGPLNATLVNFVAARGWSMVSAVCDAQFLEVHLCQVVSLRCMFF